MVTSSILSRNGAGISITGTNLPSPIWWATTTAPSIHWNFRTLCEEGSIFLPSGTGECRCEQPWLSGSKWASTGIQVIQGGSVGQMAKAPIVNSDGNVIVNSDGTVTVNVVKDPAGIPY